MTSPTQHRLMDKPPGPVTFPPSIAEIDAECVQISREYPAWHAWCNPDGSWSARLLGGRVRDRVSAPDPVKLRKRIREYVP